jgi:hypothetical protein
MIRRPVRHPLPAVIATVSVLMCGGAVFAGLHGVGQARLPVAPPGERTITYPTIGVAGASAEGWNDLTGIQAGLQVSYVSMRTHVTADLFRSIEINADGAEPIIDIEPYGHSLAQVAAGVADGWLRQLAIGIKGMNRPVVVAFAPEANGNWYPWELKPGPFRIAWRHVWDVVSTAAQNKKSHHIKWMWQMSSHDRIGAYWPGKHYVNWVGIDGYFRTPKNTFHGLFHGSLATVKQLTKTDPILLSETAVGPMTNAQAADITELFAAAKKYGLIAVVWFQKRQHSAKGQDPSVHQDWRLKPGSAALATFKADALKYINSSRKKRSPK